MSIGSIGSGLGASYLPQVGATTPDATLTFAQKKEKATAAKQESVDEFLKWSKMSPIERLRAQYLKDHNLTEEELASLPTEERQKIEDEIKKLIEEMLKKQTAQKAGANFSIDV